MSSTWFQESEIHHLEHKALPQFFLGNPGRSPEHYKYIRNSIITLCKQHPHLYISASECLNHVSGDCCDIVRVHSFLEHWGLINFTSDLMNQQTQKIFPVNSTNVLRGVKGLRERELDPDWEMGLEDLLFRQQFREFDKFEGINWIRREIGKIAGFERPRLESKNQIIREVIKNLKRKKKLKCDECHRLVGEWFYSDRVPVARVIEGAIRVKGQSGEAEAPDLKTRFHLSQKPSDKIIRKIAKQELEFGKVCSNCFDERLLNDKGVKQLVDPLSKTSLGTIIREYTMFLEKDGRGPEAAVANPEWKKKVLGIVNEFEGQLGRVLERVPTEERKKFLMNYMEVALQDLKGLKGILRKNFDFFHRITTDLNRKNSLQDLQGFKKVQAILKKEDELKEFDDLIECFVDSQDTGLDPSGHIQESAKRSFDQFAGAAPTPPSFGEGAALTKLIRQKVDLTRRTEVESIRRLLQEYIITQVSKIKKKLNSIEDYEKFLLHEESILQIKKNQFLTSQFMNTQIKD